MTPSEIQTELSAIAAAIGPNAEAHVSIHENRIGGLIFGSIFPYGVASSRRDGYITARADTFEEVFAGLREKWASHADEHRTKTIREMALAIIRLTSQHGECTDAALRAEFDIGAVKRWGADACALANEMAGKGPFEIVAMRGANVAA